MNEANFSHVNDPKDSVVWRSNHEKHIKKSFTVHLKLEFRIIQILRLFEENKVRITAKSPLIRPNKRKSNDPHEKKSGCLELLEGFSYVFLILAKKICVLDE